MKKKILMISLTILLILALLATPVLAKDKHTKVKPFMKIWEVVKIWKAISDLQEQIDNIISTPPPFAGQMCPEGQCVIGFDDEGNIICSGTEIEIEKVVINEVYYDEPGPDGPNIFTELFGPAGKSLDGWTLEGINCGTGLNYRTIDLTGVVIPADGLLVIATSDAIDPTLAARDFSVNIDWQNGPDAILLVGPDSNTMDALQYGVGNYNFGEGNPAPDVAPGYSLSRDSAHTDTDDNFSDFLESSPTPGTP